jgi:predicted NBD/HSP70 family sugar kinase
VPTRPPLDPDFRPMWVGLREFSERVREARRSEPLTFALERESHQVSIYRTHVLPESDPRADQNFRFVERVLKILLWQRGAGRVRVAGPPSVTRHLSEVYSSAGARRFDVDFFGRVYGTGELSLEAVPEQALPKAYELPRAVGGHFDGCRIGFDAGGSDRKVVAVHGGRELFACEVPWEPKLHSDPEYHVAGVEDSIRRAAEHLPRIDAIGVSSAGIYVNNETRIASLFRRVPEAGFEAKIQRIYPDLARRWGDVPLEVANDGDVAALAGALELGRGALLGLALGTSLAAGYVDADRRIHGWLNELAFAPIDDSEQAVVDREWSGDAGTGAQYLSQEAVPRLAPRAGLTLRAATHAEQLAELQALANEGEPRAHAVYESIGIYLGHAILLYADFYDLREVLLLGRVTSGKGGHTLSEAARAVLEKERPELGVTLHLPRESTRRVGQAMAAASLPSLNRTPSHETP